MKNKRIVVKLLRYCKTPMITMAVFVLFGQAVMLAGSSVVWTTHAIRKVLQNDAPGNAKEAAISAAKNEYESFQVVVSALSDLKGVDVSISDLTGPSVISKSKISIYRVHYVDCGNDGFLPDSMVPMINPATGAKIGGRYGFPFDLGTGKNQPIWVEVYVPDNANPGDYTGILTVTIPAETPVKVPVKLHVWNFTLPKTTALKTFFSSPSEFVKTLHQYRIDPWSVAPALTCTDNGNNVTVNFTPEYDKIMDDYFSGAYFEDGIGGKSALIPSHAVKKIMRSSEEKRIQILKQFENHFKNKPYRDKLYWFFIDEPNSKTIDSLCIPAGKNVKQYSPSIKFMLTTGYKEKLAGLVDLWDSIINAEVMNARSPGPDPYRDEIKKGRDAIDCITVNSDIEYSPNLFIPYSAMNTRVWTWVTHHMGFSGIEFWDVGSGYSKLTITKAAIFGKGHAWGDGYLFYPGKASDLGIPSDIILPSIRLKILRDAIEDYEYLAMAGKKYSQSKAEEFSRKIAQDTKNYDGSFHNPVHVYAWHEKGIPEGHVVWESSPERIYETRAGIAKLLDK